MGDPIKLKRRSPKARAAYIEGYMAGTEAAYKIISKAGDLLAAKRSLTIHQAMVSATDGDTLK